MIILPEKLTLSWLREHYLQSKIDPEQVIAEISLRAEAAANMSIWIVPPDPEWIRPYLDRLSELEIDSHPLWGIPFAIKDNIDLAGVLTTAACPDYAYMPDQNAAVVDRLIEAGAIPVGKTNLDQFATGLVGTRSPFGAVPNALRQELISGGSSAGSAASVAKGQAVFALGTDTAGSGRVPAALNGLYGWKPSCGAWPLSGVVPACASLDCVTVFANSIDDCLVVDHAVRGRDAEDPWSQEYPYPEPQRPERIFLPAKEPEFFGPFAENYQLAWHKTVDRIRKIWPETSTIDGSLLERAAGILYEGPWIAERWADLGRFVETHPGSVLDVTEKILRSGIHFDAASLFEAIHELQSMKAQVKKLLHEAVLILPTCGGTWTREQVIEDPVKKNSALGKYTNHCNLLDLCAVAVPSGWAAENLPFGITLFALAGKEGLLAGFLSNAGKHKG
ncbi:Allophanate hydrolase [Syntrophobotulus glycolicus DSM 8271]|uniref:Allophanate hydrolase n=1 Tax=Syntrophobotulus glycolicus (strain DSM 8271 / FlGlyR) TaxID=645991 RepID=F0T197_SYNGF|nr:allophanate hydrolase [Syntrophobotulus glycolicus]ADY55161.1 Allophanate hydrolase [Syntrophobotulus glycolicus DSM 8271]